MILNNEPYGNELSYNALRYEDQKPPEGHYNIARMLSILLKRDVTIRACGTCLDARGINEEESIMVRKNKSIKGDISTFRTIEDFLR